MLLRLVPLLVVAVCAAACGAGGDPSSDAQAALDEEWTLTSGTGPNGDIEVGDGVEITLTIDGDDWGGTVCNHYGAQSVDTGDGTVTIRDVAHTEMACLDDRLMTAEDAYLDAFIAVTAYEVSADELRLTGDGVELVYAPVPSEPSPDLVGTVWVLDTLFQGAGPDGSASSTVGEEATLELREDGRLLASSGCSRRDGSYEVDGTQLVVRFAADPDGDCDSEDVRAQDRHVWDVLDGDPTVEIDGQRLTLVAGDVGLGYQARQE